MSDTDDPQEAGAQPATATQPQALGQSRQGVRLQISLLHLFVAVACCAIWIVRMNLVEERLRLKTQLRAIREAARELVVPSPEMVAAVGRLPLREEMLWDVYVPPQGSFELRMASEQIYRNRTPPIFEAVPLSPGRHTIELRGAVRPEESDLQLIVDGHVAVDAGDELREYSFFYGSATDKMVEGNHARPPHDSITLISKRFNPPPPDGDRRNIQPLPRGPTDGVFLWIQPL